MGCNKLLGDRIEEALSRVGVTSERVSEWIGRPCNCSERKVYLNQLNSWAIRVIKGNTQGALEYLNRILNQ